MMAILFKFFLEDKRVYKLNQQYWRRLFDRLFKGLSCERFYNTTYLSGKDFYDGNPIASAYVKDKNKIIRIIQEEPEDSTYIFAYLDKATEDNIPELVIRLSLSAESKRMAEDLISKWILDDLDNESMENYIKSTNTQTPAAAS